MAPREAPGSWWLQVVAAEASAAPGARASGRGSWPSPALCRHLHLINAGGCLAALDVSDVLVVLRGNACSRSAQVASLHQLCSRPPPGLGLASGAAP